MNKKRFILLHIIIERVHDPFFNIYIFYFQKFSILIVVIVESIAHHTIEKKNSLVEYAYFQYFLSAAVLTLSLLQVIEARRCVSYNIYLTL